MKIITKFPRVGRGFTYDLFAACAIGLSFTGLIIYGEAVRAAIAEALSLCGRVLIPSLFPCLVIASAAVECGFVARIGKVFEPLMRPLFKLPGECAASFIMGLTAGYPVGAKTAIELYEKGVCSRAETERLLAFCNNSGPAFIFGAVGAALFSSVEAGLLLFASHALASVVVGLIFRFYKKNDRRRPVVKCSASSERRGLASSLVASIKSSASSVINICAYVVFFTAAIKVLTESGLIPKIASFVARFTSPLLSAIDIENLIAGLFELSSGIFMLARSDFAYSESNIGLSLVMAAFMLGWAGLSVHCQVLSFIGEKNLSFAPYIVGKLLHGVLSALFTFVLCGFSRSFALETALVITPSVYNFRPFALALCSVSSIALVLSAMFIVSFFRRK